LNSGGGENRMKEDILMEEIKERITAINYIKKMLFKLRKTDIRKLYNYSNKENERRNKIRKNEQYKSLQHTKIKKPAYNLNKK
jgi:hypothetical protein